MNSTFPPIQPHTKAKHEILRYHIDEWFPILGRSQRTLLYIDGFAGPGEYAGGDPGSPIVALNTIRRHHFLNDFSGRGKTIEFLFVEKEGEYYRHLYGMIGSIDWPNTFSIGIKHAEFESVLTNLLDEVDADRRPMPPTLAFIDPFGSTGFPMDLMGRLASYDRIDVLITSIARSSFDGYPIRVNMLPQIGFTVDRDGGPHSKCRIAIALSFW